MITLQVFINVYSPPNYAVVDLNCETCICFHPSLVFLDSKLFVQHFVTLTFAFDCSYVLNCILACCALGRSILALEVDYEIFDEVFKPFLDAKSSENIVKPSFNLDDNSPIQKKIVINFDCE